MAEVKPTIRVLIADDHRLFRQGLRQICEAKCGFQVVGEAANGQEAVDQAQRLKPDVVLMDLRMPVMDGIQATRLIVKENPLCRIIILTIYREDDHIFNAIKAGAQGYLLKDIDWRDLREAVYSVCQGNALISPALAMRVFDEFRRLSRTPGSARDVGRLTAREMEVLCLVAQGLEDDEIAERLHLSKKTITNRLSDIYRKLNVNNRTQAALYALRRGWATLDGEEVI